MQVKLVSLCSVFFLCYVANCKKIVCYYGSWASYRPGLGKFDVSNINTDLCTHVVYTFAGISSQGTMVSLDPYLDLAENWGRDNFRQFTNLKQNNSNLKTILAVGGWNEGSKKFSIMASNATNRQTFINSVTEMLSKYNFDGLDLDWEYPNRRDTVYGLADVNNFSIFLREMRQEFDKRGFLLSAAVSAVEASASHSYDIRTISQYLDYVNIMAYDMYGAWDAVTGHNAPLHKGAGDDGIDRKSLYTVDVALDYWIEQGCPPEKIVLGVPFYGRTFQLTNASNNNVRAPSSGPGISGPYTATNGVIGYNEFCQKLQAEPWTIRYDDLAKVPYAFRDNNWVSFDNADSIKTKVLFGMSRNIAGIMVWSIETDDFNNVCGGGHFPLLKSISTTLNGFFESNFTTTSATSFTTTAIPISTTTSTTTNMTISSTAASTATMTSDPSPGISNSSVSTEPIPSICKFEGYEADPTNCACFYVCLRDGWGNLRAVKFNCPDSLYWDKVLLVCNYPNLTECNV